MQAVLDRDIRDLTLEELQFVKRAWFEQAAEDGKVEAARLVAMRLGRLLGEDYEYDHDEGGTRISFRAHKFFRGVRVLVNGRKVLDSWQGESLFVPGGWELVMDRLYGEAQALGDDQERGRVREAQRQALIDELLLEE